MYTVEKIKTNDVAPDGQAIWLVLVRDYKGHVTHTDYCYECDLDRMFAEFEEAFQTIPDPGEIVLLNGAAVHNFAFYLTEQEVKQCCQDCNYQYLDPDGTLWEMLPRRIVKEESRPVCTPDGSIAG